MSSEKPADALRNEAGSAGLVGAEMRLLVGEAGLAAALFWRGCCSRADRRERSVLFSASAACNQRTLLNSCHYLVDCLIADVPTEATSSCLASWVGQVLLSECKRYRRESHETSLIPGIAAGHALCCRLSERHAALELGDGTPLTSLAPVCC